MDRQTSEHVGRPTGRPLGDLAAPASLALYALLVSHPVVTRMRLLDRRGCTDPHALWAVALIVSGALAALSVTGRLHRSDPGIAACLTRLLPGLGPTERRNRLRGAAALTIGLGMVSGFLWVVPGVDRFTDHSRVLSTEAAVLLYAMGVLTGAAWSILLGPLRWLGLPFTAALGSMWAALSLAPRSWC